MHKLIVSTLAILALVGSGRTGQAFIELTVENKTVNAGTSTTLNVIWSSTTALDYLTTNFMITAVGGATSGAATFTNTSGVAPLPPLNDTNYVFSGDSDDAGLLPINPASVSTTTWSNDTYNFADSTSSLTDYAQNGSRLWTILNIDISGLASGQYQIVLGSSEYTNAANPTPNGLTPTMTGGLITINQVPEPGTWALAVIATAMLGAASRRRIGAAG